MLIEAHTQDFAALLRGEAPAPYRLADSPVAPPEVLAMLSDLADHIRATFSPSAWMIVEDGEVVGLISSVQPLDAADRSLLIGYGVAPTRWGRGAATRAVASSSVRAPAIPTAGRRRYTLSPTTSTAAMPIKGWKPWSRGRRSTFK